MMSLKNRPKNNRPLLPNFYIAGEILFLLFASLRWLGFLFLLAFYFNFGNESFLTLEDNQSEVVGYFLLLCGFSGRAFPLLFKEFAEDQGIFAHSRLANKVARFQYSIIVFSILVMSMFFLFEDFNDTYQDIFSFIFIITFIINIASISILFYYKKMS